MVEDGQSTLVFVDILGFANLTMSFPHRLVHSGPDVHGIVGTSTSPASNTLNRFHRILDTSAHEHSLNGKVRAMLFSDCAFLDYGNSLLGALAATELMRKFILERVPVRMGIGRGTFYPIKFSTDIVDATIITRSLFLGTAVVRAHSAERCGGKGLRIFVDSSLEPELGIVRGRVKTIPLVPPLKDARWELDFLHEVRPAQRSPSAEDDDRRLFEAVNGMKDEAPADAHHHYADTIEAMNRMRQANGRIAV